MSNKAKAVLVPKLRFPEFRGAREWNRRTLSSVATVVMGSSPKSEFYNADHNGLPLLQGNADIKNRLSAPRVFTSETTKECQVGDILMSVRAPVGNVAKSIHHACIGRGIAAIHSKKPNSQEFLYQWLLSYEPRWVNISQGGTFDAINGDDLKGVGLTTPLPDEQQKIADCLSSLDELIAAQARKVDALKTHKKGLMQQLFPREGETRPRLRFPEFRGAGDWAETELGQLLEKVIDYRGKPPPKAETGIPLITAKNVRFGWLDMAADEYIEAEAYDAWMTKGIPTAGDILFTTEAPLGNVAMFPCEGKFALGQRIITLRCKTQRCVSEFLFHSLLGPAMQETIDFHSTGSTAKGIKSSVFVALGFRLPNIDEQQSIADCLTSLDTLITAATRELETLKTHKKGLMQQLFPSPEALEA